jgi:hypothetical protein
MASLGNRSLSNPGVQLGVRTYGQLLRLFGRGDLREIERRTALRGGERAPRRSTAPVLAPARMTLVLAVLLLPSIFVLAPASPIVLHRLPSAPAGLGPSDPAVRPCAFPTQTVASSSMHLALASHLAAVSVRLLCRAHGSDLNLTPRLPVR